MMISRSVSRFRWIGAVGPLLSVALGTSAGAATLFGFATSDLTLTVEIEHGCVPWEGYGFASPPGSFEDGGTLVMDSGSGGSLGGSGYVGGSLTIGSGSGYVLSPGSSAGNFGDFFGDLVLVEGEGLVLADPEAVIEWPWGGMTFDSLIIPFFEVEYELHTGYPSDYIFTPDGAGSVPEPGAAFLLGLGGLFFLRRVRK